MSRCGPFRDRSGPAPDDRGDPAAGWERARDADQLRHLSPRLPGLLRAAGGARLLRSSGTSIRRIASPRGAPSGGSRPTALCVGEDETVLWELTGLLDQGGTAVVFPPRDCARLGALEIPERSARPDAGEEAMRTRRARKTRRSRNPIATSSTAGSPGTSRSRKSPPSCSSSWEGRAPVSASSMHRHCSASRRPVTSRCAPASRARPSFSRSGWGRGPWCWWPTPPFSPTAFWIGPTPRPWRWIWPLTTVSAWWTSSPTGCTGSATPSATWRAPAPSRSSQASPSWVCSRSGADRRFPGAASTEVDLPAPALDRFVASLASLYARSRDKGRVAERYRELTLARLRRHFGLPAETPARIIVERLRRDRRLSPELLGSLTEAETPRGEAALRAQARRLDALVKEAVR